MFYKRLVYNSASLVFSATFCSRLFDFDIETRICDDPRFVVGGVGPTRFFCMLIFNGTRVIIRPGRGVFPYAPSNVGFYRPPVFPLSEFYFARSLFARLTIAARWRHLCAHRHRTGNILRYFALLFSCIACTCSAKTFPGMRWLRGDLGFAVRENITLLTGNCFLILHKFCVCYSKNCIHGISERIERQVTVIFNALQENLHMHLANAQTAATVTVRHSRNGRTYFTVHSTSRSLL